MRAAGKGSATRHGPPGTTKTGELSGHSTKTSHLRDSATNAAQKRRRGLSLLLRAGLVALGLLVIGIGARWAASQAVPNIVRVPEQEQLAAFPKQLGPWKCEDEEKIDAKMFQALGTGVAVTRRYSQSAERFLEMHAAVFTQPGFSLPHPPELCYSGTGWRVRSTRDVPLTLIDGTSGSVRFIRLVKERGDQQATVLYCYQLAGPFSADRDKVRTFFWKFRGQKSRPPLVKLMLHLPGSGETIENLGLDFAQRALEKLAEMEKTW
ncbi:MAG TPA: exosortase-associated EpsI family protein [Thermogutta sp.]|nr:exosortase-associated EpsI family protein [Thermogutta sp.]HQF13796.1 exosortase-associated EpsI family protein [Thermogutta sp.]